MVVNQKCKELAYVIRGSGKVVIEGKEIKLKQDDLVLIEPEERYMEMFVFCVPAWYPEQHKEIK